MPLVRLRQKCTDGKSASPAPKGSTDRAAQRSAHILRIVLESRVVSWNWCGTCFLEVAMRRFAALTLILAAATAVSGVYLVKTGGRDPLHSVAPRPAALSVAEGTTCHGLIAQVDKVNRSLEIEVNGRSQRIFWDDRTLITVAKHRVKSSALVPGATVFVDVQQKENRLQASLISVSLPMSSGSAK